MKLIIALQTDTDSLFTFRPQVEGRLAAVRAGRAGRAEAARHGMAGEFHDSESCSAECKRRIKEKIREREKKERELLVQKARREAKKKEKQMEKEAAAVSSVKQRQRIKGEDEVTPAAGDDGSPEPSTEKAKSGCGQSIEG